ncbi:MAG: hypothetical protein JRH10_08640 [Deltaproteobacteria bacterium]|nr:hypothetical protein [Deltaproteobacteria bacterium]MBW2446708.1 hypothetical protein [Deltaproteobacteria bacterium]
MQQAERTGLFSDFTVFLWLLKLGAVINLYFLANTLGPASGADPHIVIPAQILFAVSAYRCLFPNRYKDNVVFHDSRLSSIFVTRVLATFVEVAYIYQFSHVLRLLNVDHVGWVNALSWVMVAQVVVSQGFVWGAIAAERLIFYYYEELGWGVIFVANTIASAYLYATVDAGAGQSLLQLNLIFGAFYLPWQLIHVRALRADARASGEGEEPAAPLTWGLLAKGLSGAIHERNRQTGAEAWGGSVGLVWMVAYWATLIPMWVHHIVGVFAAR